MVNLIDATIEVYRGPHFIDLTQEFFAKNFTAPHYACGQGASPPVVQALIDDCSDVNAWDDQHLLL